MAALPTADRKSAAIRLARRMAQDGPLSLTKDDLLAAVAGIDDYLEANAAAMNTAIPQPARGAMTSGQKAGLFAFVALAKFGE